MSNLTPLVLIDTNDVHAVMGSDPELLAAVAPSFESAIVRAGVKLQTVLDTLLAPLYNTDTFFIDETLPPLKGRYRLRLRNGLVRQDVAFTVQWSDDPYADASSWQDVIGRRYGLRKGVRAGACGGRGFLQRLALAPARRLRQRRQHPVLREGGLRLWPVRRARRIATDYEELRQALLCYVPLLMLSTSPRPRPALPRRAP
jgi:hypothetical protein